MAETQLAILRTRQTDELVTKVPRQRNDSLSLSLLLCLRCGRWINDLMLSIYSVDSIPRSRINTEIIEQL